MSVSLTLTFACLEQAQRALAAMLADTEKDGGAIAAVKGKTRLANATGVDPLPSSPSPDLSLVQATADRDAGHMPTCALTPRDDLTVGTYTSPATSQGADGHPLPSSDALPAGPLKGEGNGKSGRAVPHSNLAGRNSDSSDSAILPTPAIETPAIAARQAGISQTEDQTPEDRAATSSKDGCMKPHDCVIKFKTTALCWKCNAARPKAGASA